MAVFIELFLLGVGLSIEEGLCGRTTVFQDELREGRRGLDMIGVTIEMHDPLDLVIIMLGTNDCKARYRASASMIAKGLEQVIRKARTNASPSATDREHLNEAGHAALADAVYDKILSLGKGFPYNLH